MKKKKKKGGDKTLHELTMMDEYIIYNQDFEIVICQICNAGITDAVQLHFQRHHKLDVSLEIRQKITAHVRDLIIRPIQDVIIPSKEIEAIKGIKVIPGFKCTAGFGCQELRGTQSSIEKHCRITHDWNTAKGNTYCLVD